MLRPYQKECLAAIKAAYDNGVSKALVVLPTGSGKTVIFSQLPATMGMRPGEQMLLIVHRDELVYQSLEKLRHYNPALRVDVEKAEQRAAPDADIVVASLQSIGRAKKLDNGEWEYGPRLRKFDERKFRYIVHDESHHAISPSNQHIFRYFRCLKGDKNVDNSKLLCGWTATPKRGDCLGLEAIFDKVVLSRNTREMIEEGYLSDCKAYRIWTKHDISNVHTRSGDFDTKELEDEINTPIRNKLILDKYRELGEGMTAVAFTNSIQHSDDLAAMFNTNGIPAYPISGNTPDQERKELIAGHASGDIKVLASCGVLNEGWDNPRCSVALMARPTKSSLLFQQQLGRVLRCYPAPESRATHTGWAKPYAIVLDFVDQTGRHEPMSIASLFGLRASFDAKGEKIAKTVKDIEDLERKNPMLLLRSCEDMNEIHAVVEEVNLFRAPAVCTESKFYSRFSWVQESDDTARLSTPQIVLYIVTDQLGQRQVWESKDGYRKMLGTWGNPASAFEFADQLVPEDCTGLVLATARWRKEEPTEKQARMIYFKDRKLRGQFSSADDLYRFIMNRFKAGDMTFSKGGCSNRIDALMR